MRSIPKSLPLAALAAVLALLAVLLAPAASAQTSGDIAARDQLIANQETLLNTYRCRFGVDTQIVPGGCTGGGPVPARNPDAEPADPAAGPAISAGRKHACATAADRTAFCWGDNEFGQTDTPDAGFDAVSAGWEHTCGTTVEGTAVCWGDNRSGQADAPAGQFAAVSAGGGHSCGLRPQGTVVCWGHNSSGQADAPAGQFAAVAAGGRHTCGLRLDGTAVCWGLGDDGQSTPPAGRLAIISAGWKHTCGLRPDGTPVCWGLDDDGQSTPPAGRLADISAEDFHSCGLRLDGAAACWGRNSYGQSAPPPGDFADISAGWLNTCAIRADYSIACWGANASGQSNPAMGGELGGGMTAADLGCELLSPAPCLDGDGGPAAVRLLIPAEIRSLITSGSDLLHDYMPLTVPDSESLGYITECLREYHGYPLSRFDNFRLEGPPVAVCNAVWSRMTGPLDHWGGNADVRCVWDAFEAFHLRDAISPLATNRAPIAWAEMCPSWLDPDPHLPLFDRCANLYARMAPERYEHLPTRIIAGFCAVNAETQTFIDRWGRCGELRLLARHSYIFALTSIDNGDEYDDSLVAPVARRGTAVTC